MTASIIEQTISFMFWLFPHFQFSSWILSLHFYICIFFQWTSEGWAEAEGPAGRTEAVWPGALWTVGGSVWRRVSLNFGELRPVGQELGVQKASPCLVHSRCTDTQTPSHTAASEPFLCFWCGVILPFKTAPKYNAEMLSSGLGRK